MILLDSSVWRCDLQGVYILSAVRTPIGKFGGALASLTAADMGVVAAKAAIERAGDRAGAGRRNDLRQRAPGGRRTERGAADFGAQRSSAGSSGVHREQSLRFGNEVDCAGVSSRFSWRRELHSGGRHRVDVARSLLSRRRALGIPAGQSGDWSTACIATDFSVRWPRW